MSENVLSSIMGRDMAVDLGTQLTENLVHGSDSSGSAAREIGIFFPGL